MNILTKIEIWWTGPHNLNAIRDMKESKDFGLYQIYGTHNVNGPNALLYIGQAIYQNFATRISQHNWTEWEYSNVEIYIGRLGGVLQLEIDEWEKQIDIAERLLIYYCKPPYNSKNLNDYGNIKDTIVINFAQKNRLPMEVSTFYSDSEFWSNIWTEYKNE
ncbi:MAG: hypothetical protein K0B10_14645 [Vicingaceae bacterium]|nr:hypothetical protein [Vicingaceae bacterium]